VDFLIFKKYKMENKEITDLAKEFFEMADFNKDNFVCKEDYI